jgi:DNA gyrase subunit A
VAVSAPRALAPLYPPEKSPVARTSSSQLPLPPSAPPPDVSLVDEAQRRYLNYALSVITSRALPDVRDGLKPVQRRILYTMRADLGLTPDARHRKSAKIVGDVMGSYHPHGDNAIYDAMVRMAQGFVMRAALVDGQGNFGSPDGDAAAAYRYTEAKLRPLAMELLDELGQRTVDFRPNYDGTKREPMVLPARFPNLLVNGSQGIAVGMATSIPPHNLGEVVDACISLVAQKMRGGDLVLPTARLLTHVKGPDFPTGGQLLTSKRELEAVYEAGQGSLKLRGEWELEETKKGAPTIVITSVPYAVERGQIVEKIAEIIIQKKLGALVDVRDESTDEVRVVLELRRDADPQLVMAYLFKNTPLQVTVAVNLTCLVPTGGEGSDTSEPKRLGLGEILRHFLEYRFLTVTRRTQYDLDELRKRIHLLEGFEIVFDALDEVIELIRKSDGRADAKEKLMKRFSFSDEQTEAILELRLYRLAKLEIQVIRKELGEKRTRAKELELLLKSETMRWRLVSDELAAIKKTYADKRRTKIVGASDEPEFQAEDFIADEDANVLLTAQGWLKRVREVRDLGTTRVREGDALMAVVAGSTRATCALFSSQGTCFVSRIFDVPASTGYGDPVQKLFKMGDGERILNLLSLDPRVLEVPPPSEGAEPEPPFALAVTRGGLAFRFSLRGHRDPSTRAGRKFARPADGDEVLTVLAVGERDYVLAVASDGHALAVPVSEIPILAGSGKGSLLIKLEPGERLVGASVCVDRRDVVTVETEKGKGMGIAVADVLGARAAKGSLLVKRDRFARVVPPALVIPTLEVS